MSKEVFLGPFIHIIENRMVVVPNAAIVVENGKITKVDENPNTDNYLAGNIVYLTPGQFLIPGFIDCHIHAPQFPNLGIGYDRGLLQWLETYTFPLECKYSDENFASTVYEAVVKRTVSGGTTTACYFASIHKQASFILAQKAAAFGQRAFIGKVDMNAEREDGYYENTETCLENTKKFVDGIQKMKNPLIKPIITPRFALSCDEKLMRALGTLAKEKDLHIQTHISENLEEIKTVEKVYGKPYAEVYGDVGLLTNKTILAHGVHLTDHELKVIGNYGTAIIHCPSSNTFLKSGLCDVPRLRANGIKVGLGTDVSGGTNTSIMSEMKAALEVSNHLHLTKGNDKILDYQDVFYLATLGGAKCLAIDDRVGNFMPGKEFDALLIDLNSSLSGLDNLKDYTLLEKLQRLIYSGDDRNIAEVYVNGRKVKTTMA